MNQAFFPAKAYHQDFMARIPNYPYIRKTNPDLSEHTQTFLKPLVQCSGILAETRPISVVKSH